MEEKVMSCQKQSVSTRIEKYKYQSIIWSAPQYPAPYGFEYPSKVTLATHNAIGSVFAWLLAAGNSRERRLLLWDIFSLIILVPLALMGTSLGCKVLSKDVVGVMTGVVLAYTRFLQLAMITATITLDAGILTWTLVRLQYHFLHWYNWYKRNCKVILLGYPEPPSTLEVQHVSSATVREMQF
ncbi:hypothetical protein GE061_004383 [Apolygus lucorum]|uniref:Uncharacterized protein n=1 Tax=Apolygus lucorum TaxID=248454 RepID=A0A8S9WZ51_APOLU|nr:hypothetical protein GE061_004383 [Apolygus lucorum]